MTARDIPVDRVKAEDALLTEFDWAAADGAHERFKRLLDEMPPAKARFIKVLAEMDGGR